MALQCAQLKAQTSDRILLIACAGWPAMINGYTQERDVQAALAIVWSKASSQHDKSAKICEIP